LPNYGDPDEFVVGSSAKESIRSRNEMTVTVRFPRRKDDDEEAPKEGEER
jgi:hypothetical protein